MTYELEIERLIDGPVDDVFDAFTDPTAVREWYEHTPGWMVEARSDLREGGSATITFGPPGEAPYREDHAYQVVDRPLRLVYAETFTHPDGTTSHTVVAVTFADRDGKTLLTIVQTGFHDEEERDATQHGWPSFIDGLEKVVARRRVA